MFIRFLKNKLLMEQAHQNSAGLLPKNPNNMANIPNIYGVISNGVHTDVSTSLRYAKQYATKHGFSQVSIRYKGGYNAEIIAHKLNGVWQEYSEQKENNS